MAAYTDVKPLITDTMTESISQLLLWTEVASVSTGGCSVYLASPRRHRWSELHLGSAGQAEPPLGSERGGLAEHQVMAPTPAAAC